MTNTLDASELARIADKMNTAQKITIDPATKFATSFRGAYLSVTKGISSETWFIGVDDHNEFTFHRVV